MGTPGLGPSFEILGLGLPGLSLEIPAPGLGPSLNPRAERVGLFYSRFTIYDLRPFRCLLAAVHFY
jgi:hypothetical protein